MSLAILTVYSSEEPGPEDCVETLTLNNSILYVPNGTVCFECNYKNLLIFSNDVLFRINETVINNSSESAGVVKNTSNYTDTLVVFDTAEWFEPFSVTYVQCCEVGDHVSNVCKGMYNFARTGVFLIGRFIITLSCIMIMHISTCSIKSSINCGRDYSS